MPITLVLLTAVLSVLLLIGNQPRGQRTIIEPGVLVASLFSAVYVAPTLSLALMPDMLQLVEPAVAARMSLYAFVFLIVFTAVYLCVPRQPFTRHTSEQAAAEPESPARCFVWFCICMLIHWSVLKYYGVGGSGEYIDQYLERRSLPMAIQQFLNVLRPLQWMFVFALFASAFAMWHRRSSRFYVALLFATMLTEMLVTNSRSNLVALAICAAAAYRLHHPGNGIRKEIILASIFVWTIALFALRRAFSGSIGSGDVIANLISPAEFLSIYFNAVHMLSIEGTSEFLPPPGISYLQELIAFIPKNFNPGKWDLSSWYVMEYFPDHWDAGGGLAFGMIPEAVVNWGLPSMALQAAFLGVALKLVSRNIYSARVAPSGAAVLFYLYVIANIYQLIRVSSLGLAGGVVVGFILPYFAYAYLIRVRPAWGIKHIDLAEAPTPR
jgi:oligosaccharide repeat unit polymerase